MNYNFNESYFDTERIPLEGDIEAYQIQTISSDGVYETDTRFLLTKEQAYVVYRKSDTDVVAVLLLPEEADFIGILLRDLNIEADIIKLLRFSIMFPVFL